MSKRVLQRALGAAAVKGRGKAPLNHRFSTHVAPDAPCLHHLASYCRALLERQGCLLALLLPACSPLPARHTKLSKHSSIRIPIRNVGLRRLSDAKDPGVPFSAAHATTLAEHKGASETHDSATLPPVAPHKMPSSELRRRLAAMAVSGYEALSKPELARLLTSETGAREAEAVRRARDAANRLKQLIMDFAGVPRARCLRNLREALKILEAPLPEDGDESE